MDNGSDTGNGISYNNRTNGDLDGNRCRNGADEGRIPRSDEGDSDDDDDDDCEAESSSGEDSDEDWNNELKKQWQEEEAKRRQFESNLQKFQNYYIPADHKR